VSRLNDPVYQYKKEKIHELVQQHGGGLSRRSAKKLLKEEVKARKSEIRAKREEQRRATEGEAAQGEDGKKTASEDRSAQQQFVRSPPGSKESRTLQVEDRAESRQAWSGNTKEAKEYDRADETAERKSFEDRGSGIRRFRFNQSEDTEIEDRRTRYRDRPTRDNRDNTSQLRTYDFKDQRDIGDPISIPYTTAASEFLYGHSVVVAALKTQRRKLYNLYIHPRAHRDSEGVSALQDLAKAAGVKVKEVGDDWLRVMDKMSSGRPHNVSHPSDTTSNSHN